LNQETYRKLISGESGCRCPFVGLGLSFAAQVYSLVIRLRNFLYDKSWLKAHSVDAQVLSVGNITVGGTGKTPLVVWLCKFLQRKDIECAILTRGYKTHTKEQGTRDEKRETKIDEPAILAESCPAAKVIVNPDRIAGAKEAITKFGAKVLIMDDGFQHRRLQRDLDIVTIDATCPFGYGRLLPAGLLREPITSLKRADAVVITRCDQILQAELSELEAKLQQINPNMVIARSIHAPICIKYSEHFVIPAKAGIHKNNETTDSCLHRNNSIEQLKDKKIFAFCGIGNPQAFLGTIKNMGAGIVGSKIYDDHHHYSPDDLSDIYEQARGLKAELILTTQKDWSKLPIENRNLSAVRLAESKIDITLAYLAIELKFISGEDKIRNLIESELAGRISQK
jgi:tetraacyldisaccharide 4'-kinase